MESSGPSQESGHEPRKYMSKSNRACDFCRSRKSACRIIERGLSCRLCSSHGRQCTFVSGSNRKSKRGDKQQRASDKNFASAEPQIPIGYPNSQSIEVEGGVDEESPDAQRPDDSHSSFTSLEDWTRPDDQFSEDLLLFPREMISPNRDEAVLAGLPGTTVNTMSGEYSHFPAFAGSRLLQHSSSISRKLPNR